MAKPCNYIDCDHNRFGGGFCKNHQWHRTDKKPKQLKRTELKRTPLKRSNTPIKNTNSNAKFKDKSRRKLWPNMPNNCYECKLYVGEEYQSYKVSHLLEGSGNLHLYDNPRNVVTHCLQCHTDWGGKSRKEMKTWIDKKDLMIELTRERYITK